jgi:hypothetical protein
VIYIHADLPNGLFPSHFQTKILRKKRNRDQKCKTHYNLESNVTGKQYMLKTPAVFIQGPG